jgi:hypothetical protein
MPRPLGSISRQPGRFSSERSRQSVASVDDGTSGPYGEETTRGVSAQVPHDHPVVRSHRLSLIGAASTRLVKCAGLPYPLADPVPLGTINGHGMVAFLPGRVFLLAQPKALSFHRVQVPRAVLGEVFQLAPLGFQPQRGQHLGDDIFFLTLHHPHGALDEPHPAGLGEDCGKRAQQQQPPYPRLCRLVHDASHSSAMDCLALVPYHRWRAHYLVTSAFEPKFMELPQQTCKRLLTGHLVAID